MYSLRLVVKRTLLSFYYRISLLHNISQSSAAFLDPLYVRGSHVLLFHKFKHIVLTSCRRCPAFAVHDPDGILPCGTDVVDKYMYVRCTKNFKLKCLAVVRNFGCRKMQI